MKFIKREKIIICKIILPGGSQSVKIALTKNIKMVKPNIYIYLDLWQWRGEGAYTLVGAVTVK